MNSIQFRIIEEIDCEFGIARNYNTGQIADFVGNIVRLRYETANKISAEIYLLEDTLIAYPGDYIVLGESGFSVYTAKEYEHMNDLCKDCLFTRLCAGADLPHCMGESYIKEK